MSEQSWEKIADALKEVSQDFDFDSLGRIVIQDPRLRQLVQERTGKAELSGRLLGNKGCVPINVICFPQSAE